MATKEKEKEKEKKAKAKNTSETSQEIHADQATVVQELKTLYTETLLDIEQKYFFSKFFFPEILPSELEAKPTVLLVGQYSTGKTSFIKHIIGCDYPEIHIGPEPTTDRFVAVVHGDEEKVIKGNALTGVSALPFAGTSKFGSGFLNKFAAAVVPAPLLKNVNIIDTPGVLSGEKQRTHRGYDFADVSQYFAERADMILLMFDPSKLDISDEFKGVIEKLKPHEDKVHCVLNKADQLDWESLMRVYGALLWSMGKVFGGAEVSRVYVGSFQDKELEKVELAGLFKKDKDVLLSRLNDLPKSCAMRKVNEMVKRIRLCIVNVCILGHLRSQMPYLWGQEARQNYLIEHLDEVFATVRRDYQLAEGDFPNVDDFRAKLRSTSDFSKFPPTSKEVLNTLQDLLTVDIPRIVNHVSAVVNDGPTARRTNKGGGSDGEGEGSELKRSDAPTLFKIQEKENSSIIWILLAVFGALLAIVAGLLITSSLEDPPHKTLKSFSTAITQSIVQLLDNAKASLENKP